MSIEILNETSENIESQRILSLVRYLYEQLHIDKNSEIAIVFADEPTMSQLHQEWMGLEGPTDVLSFPMDELRPGDADNLSLGMLGDIVICSQVASEHAQIGGHTFEDEIALLVTHGILHLLGFDHHSPSEKHAMFEIQNNLLKDFLGYEPPQLTEDEA